MKKKFLNFISLISYYFNLIAESKYYYRVAITIIILRNISYILEARRNYVNNANSVDLKMQSIRKAFFYTVSNITAYACNYFKNPKVIGSLWACSFLAMFFCMLNGGRPLSYLLIKDPVK